MEHNPLTGRQTGYPSIDKPWLKYYSNEDILSKPFEGSIIENICENNKDYLDEIAFLYFGKKISYRKLFLNVTATAKALLSYGVKSGDNVVLCAPAIPETIYMILGLNKIGANAVMLNPTFTTEQLRDRTAETGAKVLFVVNELYSRIETIVPKTSIELIVSCPAVNSLGTIVKFIKKVKKLQIKNSVEWNTFLKNGGSTIEEQLNIKGNPDAPAIIVYSSGTTGASKGIQLTNNSINATINDGEKIGFEWERQDRWFAQVPIWFSTGICATMLVPLRYGITVILEPIYDFDLFYDHIKKYRPNFMITAAGLLDYLMSVHPKDAAYKEFKYLVIGGEYVSSIAENRFNKWLKENGSTYELYKGYGMCECGGTITASSKRVNEIGSAGIPTPHATVAAFDMNTNDELKFGERGEIRIITPCAMRGYFNNLQATEEYFWKDKQGQTWACTGDMGYIDEDGNVYISGRINDSYIDEQGETVYLFDIERAILASESIRQCKTVVSEVNGILTHVSHVVINEDDVNGVLLDINNKCKSVLPQSHVPELFKIYKDALPVSLSGKLDTEKMKKDMQGIVKLNR